MTTRLCDLLGLESPIIQAPMAGSQDSELALAVSAAGALGSLPCATLDAASLEAELPRLRDACGPINLNFFCHSSPKADPLRERAWREILAPYYEEWGIDAGALSSGPGRRPFDADMTKLLEGFAPAVVSFHFGLPQPELLERVKRLGTKILASATTVPEARWLEAHGADVIIAQGLEAGGHRGMFLTTDLTTQSSTFSLLPAIAAAVSLPVVAAGGIGDAAGVAKAKSLGAAGVQVGSAYLLCPEARTTAVHRAALKRASEGASSEAVAERARHAVGADLSANARRKDNDLQDVRGQVRSHSASLLTVATASSTALTNLFSGRPARGIVNRLMRELGPMHPAAPAFPLATAALAPLRQAAEREGLSDFSPLWCGQRPPQQILPAAVLTRRLSEAWTAG